MMYILSINKFFPQNLVDEVCHVANVLAVDLKLVGETETYRKAVGQAVKWSVRMSDRYGVFMGCV